jgi:hypothetical protein
MRQAEEQANHAALAQQANQQQQTLLALDAKLEVLMVTFDLLPAGKAKTDKGKAAKRLDASLNKIEQGIYQHAADGLEKDYKNGGWLSQGQRAKDIKNLKDAIRYCQ